MKSISLLLVFLLVSSCIPIRIAPNIKTDKVTVAKKFKRKLPKRYAFIFEDPKDANEFYNYINTKYQLNFIDVEYNVPFYVEENEFFLSFHEVEIPTKTVNLLPIVVDGVLKSNDNDPLFEDNYETRIGNWYLALTVADNNFNDCLKPGYIHRDAILKYLRTLKYEYLNTSNYLEALLKKEN